MLYNQLQQTLLLAYNSTGYEGFDLNKRYVRIVQLGLCMALKKNHGRQNAGPIILLLDKVAE